MNKADQQAGTQAIDSLINYETVKVPGKTYSSFSPFSNELDTKQRSYCLKSVLILKFCIIILLHVAKKVKLTLFHVDFY